MPYSLLLIPAFTSTSPFAAVVFGCFLHKPTIMSSALRLSNQKNESFCFSKRDRYWPYVCSNKTAIVLCKNSPLPQSCAVAKSDKFWRAIGQSNLADRMEDCSTGQSAVVWTRKANFGKILLRPAVCIPGLIVQRSTRITEHDCDTGWWKKNRQEERNTGLN